MNVYYDAFSPFGMH